MKPAGALSPLVVVPTLDEIAADPTRAADLPAEVRRALTLRATVVIAACAVGPGGSSSGVSEPEPSEDRLLTPDEAGERLGVTVPWLYRHAKTLPFTRRLGRAVRFDEGALTRWLATRGR